MTQVHNMNEDMKEPKITVEEVENIVMPVDDAPIVNDVAEPTVPAFKEGDRVRIVVDPPGGVMTTGTVKVVQDVVGKSLGVELDQFTEGCHSLDGLVEEKVDETRGITVGKGWWTLPYNLELIKE